MKGVTVVLCKLYILSIGKNKKIKLFSHICSIYI